MQRAPNGRFQPAWRIFVFPILQWVGLGAAFVIVALFIAGEVRPPTVLGDPVAREAATTREGPYSLPALHARLTPAGVEQVQAHIRYFQTKGKRRVVDGLSRGSRYIESYQEIFRHYELPEELAYLPLVESGFVATAVSPAQAAGMWQFIEETGRRYDLHRTDWADNRLDPVRSADAAARYLKSLFKEFQDWELALAAYNAGAGTVRWKIRVNKRQGLPTDFWSLDMPDETRGYVPSFLATVMIAKNPAAYGIEGIRAQPALVYEKLKVSPGISLANLAEQGGISLSALQDLNPSLIRDAVPPGEKPYVIRVPTGFRLALPNRLVGLTASPSDYVLHQVHYSDTLETLASRFRSKADRILKVNGLDTEEELLLRPFLIIPL